jgi:hypothetical protein
LDPHGLVVVRRLVEACGALGDDEGVSRWAGEALGIDERLRLDPLRRLTDEERATMRALAGAD